MNIFKILDTCYMPDSKFDRSQDRQHVADTLKNADVPKQQARNDSNDFFQDMFKTLEHAGKELEQHWGEFGRNIEGFGQHLQQGWGKFGQDITKLFDLKSNSDVNTEPSSSKPPSPVSSSGSGSKSVTFSDETSTTSKDGALIFLHEQEKLIQEKISQNGKLLNTEIDQQFPNFQTLKNLQSQFLDMDKQIKQLNTHGNSHSEQRREPDNKITEIENLQRYLALGGEVDKLQASSICAQYINKTSSRSLNPEEVEKLLNKIRRIRSDFNARERTIAQINHFKHKQLEISDPARRFDHSKLDSTKLKKLTEIESMSRALKGSDERTEVSREYLKNAFEYVVLGGQDLVLIPDSLFQVKFPQPKKTNPSDPVNFKVVNMVISRDDLEQLKRIEAIKQFAEEPIEKNDLLTLNQLFQDIALRHQVDKSVIESLEEKYHVAASNREKVIPRVILDKVNRIRQEAPVEQSVF